MNDMQVLTRYKAWADEVFLSVISTVPGAELAAPRPIVFGSLIRTLHHSYAMDYVWQCHLLGKAHGLTTRNPEHCPGLAELIENQRAIDAWYVDYADSLAGNEPAQSVDFEFIGGGAGRMSRRDIILHVVNHTTYHRGHAAGILYYLDIFPPTTDLPVFLRQHPVAGS
ncbi:DinB family protein [Tahibacter caeni]|uniref:DinB family protein n=1 Tax=Tahibacter caeni TaxID=1453545 RepID=UPI002148E32B|nr:DinB family protein [Tahibacter caeni]